MAFNLADVLAGVPNVGTGREQIEYIAIDKIVPDPDNFYDLSGLDGLAENISLLGLQQPLRVRPVPGDDGKLMIISGHRRHAAIKMLIEQDGRDDLREVPCIVERTPEENPKLKQLKLIYANAHTRVLTSAEISKQAEQVEKLLYELKAEGMEFPGRMRDHVAQAVGTSKSKLSRLKVIRDGLAECWVPHYEDNTLSESAAYELARIPGNLQQVIFDVYTAEARKYGWLSADEIRIFTTLAYEISNITCPNGGGPCLNCRNKIEKAVLTSRYTVCPCTDCCNTCYDLASCKKACPLLADKIKQIKADEKDKRQQQKAEEAESERPQRELLERAYARVKQLRADHGVSDADYVKTSDGYAYSVKMERLTEIDSGKKIKLTDRMPGGIWASDAMRLIATADLLGCSIDYLLGRTDCVSAEAAPPPATGGAEKPDVWLPGYPDEKGVYAVYTEADEICDVLILKWNGKKWVDGIDYYDPRFDGEIVAWYRLPDTCPRKL